MFVVDFAMNDALCHVNPKKIIINKKIKINILNDIFFNKNNNKMIIYIKF